MNPELRTTKYAEIDKTAEREKAKIAYIIDLIESDESNMRDAFLTEDERDMDEGAISALLFERVSEALTNVRRDLVSTSGVRIGRFAVDTPPEKTATELMGWHAYGPPMLQTTRGKETVAMPGKEYSHIQYPTDEGRRVVDGMLKAQGYIDSASQRQRNEEKHAQLWASHS